MWWNFPRSVLRFTSWSVLEVSLIKECFPSLTKMYYLHFKELVRLQNPRPLPFLHFLVFVRQQIRGVRDWHYLTAPRTPYVYFYKVHMHMHFLKIAMYKSTRFATSSTSKITNCLQCHHIYVLAFMKKINKVHELCEYCQIVNGNSSISSMVVHVL